MPAKKYASEKLSKFRASQKASTSLKKKENGDIRERILILLLLTDGKTQKEIAKLIGCSLNKICFWCVHGDPNNLESFKDDKMKGNNHKATEKYTEILLETIEKNPQELG